MRSPKIRMSGVQTGRWDTLHVGHDVSCKRAVITATCHGITRLIIALWYIQRLQLDYIIPPPPLKVTRHSSQSIPQTTISSRAELVEARSEAHRRRCSQQSTILCVVPMALTTYFYNSIHTIHQDRDSTVLIRPLGKITPLFFVMMAWSATHTGQSTADREVLAYHPIYIHNANTNFRYSRPNCTVGQTKQKPLRAPVVVPSSPST